MLDSLLGKQTESAAPADAAQSAAPALGSISALATVAPSTGTSPGQLAPDFTTTTDDGQPLRLSDFRGQVVLLNFWATWCGPCRIEMPEFESLFAQRAAEGFTVLAVNNAESAATVQAFRAEMGLGFPLALDPDAAIQSRYGILNYPSTFLLDRAGIIRSRHFGALTAGQIHELVAGALAS